MLLILLFQVLLFARRAFADPPAPGSYPDYELVATARNLTINCQTRLSIVFNGTSPGPTLYMKENYTTWVRVVSCTDSLNPVWSCLEFLASLIDRSTV